MKNTNRNIASNSNCGNRSVNIVSGLGFKHPSWNNKNIIKFLIPYSSGNPVILMAESAASKAQVSTIGFGSTQNNLITNDDDNILYNNNIAFIIPDDVILHSIDTCFINSASVFTSNSIYEITVQIYIAEADKNYFMPLTDTIVKLQPQLNGIVAEGAVFNGSINELKIKMCKGAKVMLVVALNLISGDSIPMTVMGNINAGIILNSFR